MSVIPPPAYVQYQVRHELRDFGARLAHAARISGPWRETSRWEVPRGHYRVSGWYRDASRNRAVGGAKWSQHLIGLGLDLKVHEEDRHRLIQGLQSAGLWVVTEPYLRTDRHIHAQYWPAGTFERLVRSGYLFIA